MNPKNEDRKQLPEERRPTQQSGDDDKARSEEKERLLNLQESLEHESGPRRRKVEERVEEVSEDSGESKPSD